MVWRSRAMEYVIDMKNEISWDITKIWRVVIQRFSRAEWEVSTREGYTCTVTLREVESYCTCNLPQLQKLSCVYVIAACSKESGCANINTYSLCASWYSVNNYCKSYAPILHPVPDRRFWPKTFVDQMIFSLTLEGRKVARLLFAYPVLWMKNVRVIDKIGEAIARN